MTAEQALIEENKKDPRVRYITEDANSIDLWSEKPYFDAEFSEWDCRKGTLISSLKYQVFSDWKDKDSIDCILCIDDIKPEVSPILETQNIQFYSTKCWLEDRINYINLFIKRNIDSDLCVNTEWISERNELIEKLKNL